MMTDQDLMDCISAKQLLMALNTLQQMSNVENNNELQLSFSQASQSLFNTVNQTNSGSMNFQLYMELKKKQNRDKRGNKGDKADRRYAERGNKQQRSFMRQNISQTNKMGKKTERTTLADDSLIARSRTPTKQAQLKDRGNIKKKELMIEIKDFKSRSHSPLNETNRNSYSPRLVTKSKNKQTSDFGFVSKNNIGRVSNTSNIQNKKTKDNKQNFNERHEVKASQNSKKIILERQKKGKAYIPIHQRTNQLIKEKQEKIAKLQKANLAQKQVQERQYTFKPSINDYKKIQKSRDIASSINPKQNQNIELQQEQSEGLVKEQQQHNKNNIKTARSKTQTFQQRQEKGKRKECFQLKGEEQHR